ncbi:MAG: hypothetical protein GX444_06930 [Myxococcales bacterium]|nr:hypothetical protein [Myxococcales bacterium]
MALWKQACLLALLMIAAIFVLNACTSDDDDDDNDAASGDDDDDNDDAATDDDDETPPSGRVPTTLDMNYLPVRQGDQWVMAIGHGDQRVVRNDLGVSRPTENLSNRARLSLAYFFTATDLHIGDEESPTRMDFFESKHIFMGAFDASSRPQYDLSAHAINALARTANRIQVDYGRDFDFALLLGDNADNSQTNELAMIVDVLDGGGLLTDEGWCRVDSGDLDINPNTGRDRGERNFGFQETDGEGNILNNYYRPDWPNSNADFTCGGLRRSSGDPLPWFSAIGNHDVINMGTFDPMGPLTFYRPDEYVAATSPFGFETGLPSAIAYWKENPDQKLRIANGILGLPLDWGSVFSLVEKIGLLGDYEADLNADFVLMDLLHDTPSQSNDDGVPITADETRAYMDTAGVMQVLYETGHALYEDRNDDGEVTPDDGGFYSFDLADVSGRAMPVRFVVLNTTEKLLFPQGGVTAAQLAWLELELSRAEKDRVLVVVASHHQESDTIAGGDELAATLRRHPNVICHLVGHGHDNLITPHRGPDGDPYRGYWEIETPSATDFPQQWRIVEIVDNRDGSGSIFLTNFDHFALEGDDADILSDLSRELAFEDTLADGYHGNAPFGHRGTRQDRNVELVFAIPTEVLLKLQDIEDDEPVTSVEELGHGAAIPEKMATQSTADESSFRPAAPRLNFAGLWLRLVAWAEANDPDGLGRRLAELRPLTADERARLRDLGYLK